MSERVYIFAVGMIKFGKYLDFGILRILHPQILINVRDKK